MLLLGTSGMVVNWVLRGHCLCKLCLLLSSRFGIRRRRVRLLLVVQGLVSLTLPFMLTL